MFNTQINSLAIVFIVSDLHRTHHFYAGLLGLAFEVEDFEGGYLQARLPGDVELVFVPGEAPRGSSPQVIFGLGAGGIDAMVATLTARGVEFITPVVEAPGGWSAELADPDGHVLGLYQADTLPR